MTCWWKETDNKCKMQDRDAKPERGRRGGRDISQQHCGRKVFLKSLCCSTVHCALCNCACIILLQHLLPKLICRSDWAPKVKSYASLLSFNMHRRWSFWKQAYEFPKEWNIIQQKNPESHFSKNNQVPLWYLSSCWCFAADISWTSMRCLFLWTFWQFPPRHSLPMSPTSQHILALSAFWTIDTTSLHGRPPLFPTMCAIV